MNCPVCGEVIQKGKSMCLRCGYTFKSLILHTENENQQNNNSEANDDYKEINPDDIHFGTSGSRSGGGSLFDSLFGGSIFDGLFGGGIHSVIDDIFGGLFDGAGSGFRNIFGHDDEDEEEQLYDEFGRPIGIDVFKKNDCIEVHDVECYDEHGNLQEKKKNNKKSKNPFNRFKKPNNDKK